ncbi:uncharacterized protein [Typha latifolia]|uniref:uncharacterized protein n=1 Tax=Typha latifolia TaxID=4733 RepID=UPI003C2E24B9
MEMKVFWCFTILFTILLGDKFAMFNAMLVDEIVPKKPTCVSCLETSRKAEKILSDAKLFEEANRLSVEVCHVLPADLEAKCLEASEIYVNHTRLFFKELFHEDSLCKKTELCTDNTLTEESKMFQPPLDLRGCGPCHRAIKDLKKKMKQPKMKAKLIDVLIDYCEEIEKDEQVCKTAITKYAPKVLAKLDSIKAKSLCQMIGICDSEISIRKLWKEILE